MVEPASSQKREVVVRPRGANWSFHLPEQHTVEVTEDRRYVNLSMPGRSTLFLIERIDESDPEEVVIYLGEGRAWSGPGSWLSEGVPRADGYPLPQIQDEFDRLKARWRAAGLDEQRFIAYAQGASHEDHLRMLRRTLRSVAA